MPRASVAPTESFEAAIEASHGRRLPRRKSDRLENFAPYVSGDPGFTFEIERS